MNKPLFRLGLAASLLGLCLLSYLLAFAQTDPAWEVPVAVITQLRQIPRLTFPLGTLAVLLALFGPSHKNTPRRHSAGYWTLTILCLSLSILRPFLHPEQWQGQSPLLSTIAMGQVVLVWIGSIALYWQMSRKVISDK